MGLVHRLWTTGTPVHSGPASITGWCSTPEPGLWLLRGSRPTAKGRGGGVENGDSMGRTPEAGRWWEAVAAEDSWWGCAPV
jgi:hypothetical protein